jgi:hypothetical protein
VEALLREAIVRQPQHGDAHYYLGLILDQRGSPSEATLEFLRARECEVRGPKPHWSLSQEHFERRVQNALRRLARGLSDTLDGALVVAADMPGVEVVADGVDPHVTVLVDDTPMEDGGRKVARVFVYQRNVERFAGAPENIVEEIVNGLERELTSIFPDLVAGARIPSEEPGDPTLN